MTGGASGIGAAIVRALEEAGVAVQVLDLDDGFDVGDPLAWESVQPAGLVCLNAGRLSGQSDLGSFDRDAYWRTLRTNVDGVVLGMARLAPAMPPGGSFVVTCSTAGLGAFPFDPVYAASKHALVGFVRSVASRLAEQGLRANLVCPGVVDTLFLPESRRQMFRELDFPLV